MFAIFVSAFNYLLGFCFRASVLKWLLFIPLLFIVQVLTSWVFSRLPNLSSVNSLFSSLPSEMWWILDLFSFWQGFVICVTAWIISFSIRRLPIVG